MQVLKGLLAQVDHKGKVKERTLRVVVVLNHEMAQVRDVEKQLLEDSIHAQLRLGILKPFLVNEMMSHHNVSHADSEDLPQVPMVLLDLWWTPQGPGLSDAIGP